MGSFNNLRLASSLFLLCFFFPLGALAQQLIIAQIEVKGTSPLETDQILFKLESQIGQSIDRQRIIRDIKAIYGMGLFQNVQAEVDSKDGGYILRFVVTERPRVSAIQFTGRKIVSEDDIVEAIPIKTGDIYDPVKLKQAEIIIRGLYQKKGYALVNVTAKTTVIAEKSYDVDFVIEENPKVFLTNIHIEGNHLFSDLEIKRLITSLEIDCFSWINDSGIFQEEKINQDLALIAQYYLIEGYIKVFIKKPRVILYRTPEYSRLEVFLTIEEGEQYFTGNVGVSGDLLNEQNKEDLLKLLQLKKGEVYNPFLQNQDRAAITEAYQEQGYAFVSVIPQTKIDEATRIVDVNYQIVKNEKAYIGRIEFSGNSETRDYVIRREFEVTEGELYNGKKLTNSQNNLERLGFFEPGLVLKQEPTLNEDNVLDIIAELKEAQTGTFQAQLGYSDASKLSGGVSLSKANLFGRGQTLRFSTQFAEQGVQNNFSVTFIEPRLFSTHVSTSVSVSHENIRSTVFPDQDRRENSFSFSVGFPLVGHWRLSTSYSMVDRVFVRENPSIFKRSVAPSLLYNTQNHPTFPSSGINSSFTVVQTGGGFLGGNTHSREYNFRYKQFWSLNQFRTLILMAQTRMGFLEKIGSYEIPVEDRYRIGGISTVRGFELGDIAGPSAGVAAAPFRVVRTTGAGGQTIIRVVDLRAEGLSEEELATLRPGGIFQRIFNLELLFPLKGGPVSNVRGVIFYDAGNVNAESFQYSLLGEEQPGFFDLRQSVGVGARIITPVGVLRFEFGHKLDQRKGESPDKFDFTISGLF